MAEVPDIHDVDLPEYEGAPDSVSLEVRLNGAVVLVTLGDVRQAQIQQQRREARRTAPQGKRYGCLYFFFSSSHDREDTGSVFSGWRSKKRKNKWKRSPWLGTLQTLLL